jgi:hypothetical protein
MRRLAARWIRGRTPSRLGGGIQGKDLEEELLVDLLDFALEGGGQQIVGHVHQYAVVARGVFAECVDQRGGDQPGLPACLR